MPRTEPGRPGAPPISPSSSGSPVRVGVLGAGSWGINHVRVLAAEPRCRVIAVAEPDHAKRARIAELAPGARWTESAEAVLAAPDIDAVVIAAPAATHTQLAIAAFEAGKHVLVEKPLATRLADARRTLAAAARAGTVGMVGHLMVYHPAVRRIRELLGSGDLGRPFYVHAMRVNLGRIRSDETALWCFGPHDLSMLDHILGEHPVTASACGTAVLQPGIEDVVFVTLRYGSGILANLHLSWLSPRKERRFTLVCSQKMVELDDVSPEKLRIYDKGYDRPPEFTQFGEFLTIRDGDVHIPKVGMEEPLRAEIRHFLDCIERGEAPRTDLAQGVRVTAILEAAQRSLAAGGAPLPIPPIPGDFTT
ncbi:MAG TPA: Gfo/Idh/MocA family oxidoreductase [Kofleriaceae bacterium]|nr:Gfo/Idh/MocA family oxidoreductase [Kofleriaceae bacterium]